jgi:cell division protein FtsQ
MSRSNRRKRTLRRPSLPKIEVKLSINWKAVLIPPFVLACLVGLGLLAKTALDRPVAELVVEGTFRRVTPIEVEAALDDALDETFMSLDLAELKRNVAAIDWVDTVTLSREWPDSLKVRITEHRAAASWGETGLLNVRGELFARDAKYNYAELPKLSGPEGSEHQVAEVYLGLRGRLADANLTLGSLRMDARGAIEIVLAGGQEIRVGHEEIENRLDRLFDVAVPALAGQLENVRYIDLRYTNGFAVGWAERSPETNLLAEAGTHG